MIGLIRTKASRKKIRNPGSFLTSSGGDAAAVMFAVVVVVVAVPCSAKRGRCTCLLPALAQDIMCETKRANLTGDNRNGSMKTTGCGWRRRSKHF